VVTYISTERLALLGLVPGIELLRLLTQTNLRKEPCDGHFAYSHEIYLKAACISHEHLQSV